MKTIEDLSLGFSDAQNYTQRRNKDFFNEIFVKNIFLDQLLQPNIYFLIGEKGTGKTAYATYLANNNYKETKAQITFLSSTDYDKFYTLKKRNDLDLTGYVGIWKVILLLLLAQNVAENDTDRFFSLKKSKVNSLITAINDYYNHAFAPEITNVMKVIDDNSAVAKIMHKCLSLGCESKNTIEFSETKFQYNLYYIEKTLAEAISKVKLIKDIVLFVDGIDIRPNTILYSDYIECIKGLVDATWNLNTNLLSNTKGSKKQFRIVLLLRPDIFNALNLQNATNKLLDNSVLLDWQTVYQTYKTSYLYEVAKKLLANKQNVDLEDIFETYFPWKVASTNDEREYDTAFMLFLKISLSRPRDILVIMQYLRREMIREGKGKEKIFFKKIFDSDNFQNKYSEYFMSSLKDQLSFYYSDSDFEHFIKIFDYFKKSSFDFSEYEKNYDKFIEYILENAKEIPEFVDDSKKLLQLLYESNIIMAVETNERNKTFFHFSYREKDLANINPKVPIGENITYRFHYGLYKRNKIGKF